MWTHPPKQSIGICRSPKLPFDSLTEIRRPLFDRCSTVYPDTVEYMGTRGNVLIHVLIGIRWNLFLDIEGWLKQSVASCSPHEVEEIFPLAKSRRVRSFRDTRGQSFGD